MAVVRPRKERMTFLSNYIQFRAKCVQNLYCQMSKPKQEKFSHAVTYKDEKAEANISKILDVIVCHGLFHDCNSNQGLNSIENNIATPEHTSGQLARLDLRVIFHTNFCTHQVAMLLPEKRVCLHSQ